MSSVSIVIPTWNRRALLATAFESLSRQTLEPTELVVADGGSTDGTAEWAEQMGARVVRLGLNQGFARAVNAGIRECREEWVAILNNDVTLDREWLERLVEAAESGGYWFAAGKLLDAERPEVIDGTYDEISRAGCAWRCGQGRVDGALWDRRKTIRFAPFTAALFRREIFQRVGMLDEEFESYLEDVDFGIRCARAGLAGVYEPQAVARHRGSATLGRWHRDTVRRMARNQVLLVAKHFPEGPSWRVWVGQGLWGLIALRHGRIGSYLAGKWEGLRRFGEFRGGRPAGAASIGKLLHESEASIRDLQRASGYDWYWRLYFALT